MKKINSKTIFPAVSFLIAVVWIWQGLRDYGWWDADTGPGPGFFPVLVSVILLIFSVAAAVLSLKEERAHYEREALHIIGSVCAILVANYFVGLLLALLAFLVVWLKCYEKFPWKTTLAATAVLSAIVYGVFVFWLKVPFPKGLLFRLVG